MKKFSNTEAELKKSVAYKKARIKASTKQIVWREEHSFCLFQNICKITYLDQLFYPILYHILLKLSISVNLKFLKTKTDAPVLINVFFKKYIYLSVPPCYFHQSNLFYLSYFNQSINIWTTFMLPEFMVSLFVFVIYWCFYYCFLFSLSLSFLAKISSQGVMLQSLRQPLFNWL